MCSPTNASVQRQVSRLPSFLSLFCAHTNCTPFFFFLHSAHTQEGHAKDASGSAETAGRAAGGVYRRRVKRIESAAERHTWDAATERDIARVHARLTSHDASQREWYGDSSPLTKLSEAQEERQGNGLRDLQASSLSSPGAQVNALALLALLALLVRFTCFTRTCRRLTCLLQVLKSMHLLYLLCRLY